MSLKHARIAFFIAASIGGGVIAYQRSYVANKASWQAKHIEDLIKNAEWQCPSHGPSASKRMRSLLEAAERSVPEILNNMRVNICLDKEMTEKATSLMGVFNPRNKLLLLRDDGTNQSWWKERMYPFAVGHVPEVLNTLPRAMTELKDTPDYIYASARPLKKLNTGEVDWWFMRQIAEKPVPKITRRAVKPTQR